MTENNGLSEREAEILRLVATGASNKEIARELYISTNTVKVHLRNIFAKIDAASRTEAAMYAVQIGLVEAGPNAGVNGDLGNVAVHSTGEIIAAGAENAWWARPFAVWAIVIIGLLGIGVSVVFALRPSSPTADNLQNDSPDPSRWQEMAPMPTARSGFAAIAYENTIYAIAGETEEEIVGLVERYLPSEDRWEKLTSKPTAVGDVGGVVIGGRIYVPGGRLPSGEITDRLEIFDPQTNEWQSGASIPVPVSAYAIATFEGQLYLFGGWDGEGYLSTTFGYDPVDDAWRELTPMPTAKGYAGAGLSADRIYVLGGKNDYGPSDTVEAYSASLEGSEIIPWSEVASMPRASYRFGVSSIANLIISIGGLGTEKDNFSYMEYLPMTDEWVEFPGPIQEPWSDMGVVNLGTQLYALGGNLDGNISNLNLAYQAIYTITLPLVR